MSTIGMTMICMRMSIIPSTTSCLYSQVYVAARTIPILTPRLTRADSIVNAYLIKSQVLQPERQSAQRGLVVRSRIDFFGPLSYPAIAELGLRVNNMGKSSVTYEVGIFEKDHADIRAVAEMTHVFVDGETLRPGRDGMTAGIRGALVAISTNSELRSKL